MKLSHFLCPCMFSSNDSYNECIQKTVSCVVACRRLLVMWFYAEELKTVSCVVACRRLLVVWFYAEELKTVSCVVAYRRLSVMWLHAEDFQLCGCMQKTVSCVVACK